MNKLTTAMILDMTAVMNRQRLATFALVLSLLLAGCAPQAASEQRRRFFWPPPPAEPRIEFVDFYQVEADLDRDGGNQNWLADSILGKEQPDLVFNSPADIASDGHRFMVSDLAYRQVFVFDRQAKKVRSLLSMGNQPHLFSAPYGVTIDAKGQAYVVDSMARKVFVFDANEKLSSVFGDEQLTRPTGIAVDDVRSRVYVIDPAEHRLAVFDSQGKFLEHWGGRGGGEGKGFNFPTDVDIDAEGNVYVLDSLNAKVQVFTPAGTFLRQFGERGDALGSFQVPKGIAVSPSGLVLVSDSLAKRFVIFNTRGEFLLTVGGSQIFASGKVNPGGFYLPKGIDVDSNETIWVVDALNVIVHQFQYLTPAYLGSHPVNPRDVYLPPSQSPGK